MGNNTSEMCEVCKTEIIGFPHFEIIVPLFKSESHLVQLMHFINGIDSSVPGGIQTTFVVDGRPADLHALFDAVSGLKTSYQIIKLSKNFGVGPALHAALSRSSTCVSAAFGSDLQEPIDLFLDFFKTTISNESDIAIGYRIQRDDPLPSKIFSSIYWWVNKKWIHPESPKGGLDVFAMNRKVRSEFIALKELNTNFTSQLLWIGYKVKWIGFERIKRLNGKSSWTFKKKMKLFADSIYGYTSKPISLITWMGFLSSTLFLMLGIITFVAKITGSIEVPGYAMIVLLISFGQSVTVLSLGVLGGYIFRIFENATNRPHFVIDEVYLSSD